MADGTRFEKISGGISVCVSDSHTFGTDAILLASFAHIRPGDKAVDLGSGCGIIPLLWLGWGYPGVAYAVEIQPGAVAQMHRSVAENSLGSRMISMPGDIRDLPPELPRGSFSLVTCNPPYKALGTGVPNERPERLAARHEALCTLEDLCTAAGRLLRFGGRFCICLRPERLVDAVSAMRKVSIEPKRMRFVHQRLGKEPWLFLMEGRRGSKPFLRVEAPLYLQNDDGYSHEMKTIYERGL